jgi:hypothetical protein
VVDEVRDKRYAFGSVETWNTNQVGASQEPAFSEERFADEAKRGELSALEMETWAVIFWVVDACHLYVSVVHL